MRGRSAFSRWWTLAREAPLGLLGMLALVVCVERFVVVANEADWLAPWHWDWRHTGKAARSKVAHAGVLCFGDSLMKFGVYPGVVEGRTGRSAYSFAVALGHPASSYFLLRRALEAGARPEAVLIDATPELLKVAPGSEPVLRQWPELLRPSEAVDLAWSARDPTLLARLTVAALVPSARARVDIRARFAAALRGEAPARRYEAPMYWRNIRVNKGAMVMPALETPVALDAACRSFQPEWSCDPVALAYLDRFCDLAASRGARVYWLFPPLTTEVQSLCERNGFDASQTALASGIQERHPGVVVLDARRSRYGQELHGADPIHLTRPGAEALSADVADALNHSLSDPASPRWVTLPAYRPRPPAVPLEDVHASGLALRKKAAGGF